LDTRDLPEGKYRGIVLKLLEGGLLFVETKEVLRLEGCPLTEANALADDSCSELMLGESSRTCKVESEEGHGRE
jgi:hypothetical protein